MKRAVLFLMTLFISLFVAELVLTALAPRFNLTEPYLLQVGDRMRAIGRRTPDNELAYRNVPGKSFQYKTKEFDTAVEINSNGFRGPEFDEARRSVWVFGDSYIQAIQVSQNYTACARLQRLLSDRSQDELLVHNLGVSSYSVIQYYLLAKRLGQHLRPCIVIVVLYGNDIPADRSRHRNPTLPRDPNTGLVTSLQPQEFTSRNSGWFRNRYLPFLFSRALTRINGSVPKEPPYWGLFEAEAKELYRASFTYLRAMSNFCDEIKSPLIVSALPFANQVSPHQIAIGFHTVGSAPQEFESRTQYPDEIRHYCESQQIMYADLLGPLREAAANGEALYFYYDGHLNEAGNAVVAQHLFDFIVDRGLLPALDTESR